MVFILQKSAVDVESNHCVLLCSFGKTKGGKKQSRNNETQEAHIFLANVRDDQSPLASGTAPAREAD